MKKLIVLSLGLVAVGNSAFATPNSLPNANGSTSTTQPSTVPEAATPLSPQAAAFKELQSTLDILEVLEAEYKARITENEKGSPKEVWADITPYLESLKSIATINFARLSPELSLNPQEIGMRSALAEKQIWFGGRPSVPSILMMEISAQRKLIQDFFFAKEDFERRKILQKTHLAELSAAQRALYAVGPEAVPEIEEVLKLAQENGLSQYSEALEMILASIAAPEYAIYVSARETIYQAFTHSGGDKSGIKNVLNSESLQSLKTGIRPQIAFSGKSSDFFF